MGPGEGFWTGSSTLPHLHHHTHAAGHGRAVVAGRTWRRHLPPNPLDGRDSPIPKMPATRLGAACIPEHSQGINADARRGPQRRAARRDWPGGSDAITVRRGTLYVGVFLIAASSVTLGVAAGVLDATVVANTMGALWPLAVIALGVGMVLRRTRAALGAGILAALVPGLALGASIVAVPDLPMRWMDDAWTIRHAETRVGSFARAAAMDLSLCSVGSVIVIPEGGCK